MSALPLPTSFALTLRGYDREQVDEHLAHLQQDLRLLSLDRDAAVAEAENLARRLTEARAAQAALQARIDRLCRAPADPEAVGERVGRLLELARAEAAEIVASARREAAAVVADARATAEQELAQAHRRLDRIEETRRRVGRRLTEIDAMLARSAHLLEPGEARRPAA